MRTRAERATAFVAWALPFALALLRASSHAQWRGDVAAVRDVALGGLGWGGGVSTALTQLAFFVPVGTVTFRSALVAALALAFAASSIHALALRMLRACEDASAPSRFGAPALAAVAALTATMTPAYQSEGTVGGSTMVAVALALTVARWAFAAAYDRDLADPMRTLVGLAFLLGALTAENAVLGAATLISCGAALFVVGIPLPGLRNPRAARTDLEAPKGLLVPARILRASLFGWVLGLGLFSAPGLLRAVAPNAAIDLGGPFLWGTSLPAGLASDRSPLTLWTDDVGWAALAASGFGAFTLLLTRRGRPLLFAPVVSIAGAAALYSALRTTEGTIALTLFAVAWTACLSTVGVHAFFHRLTRMRVPLARAGAVLVIAAQATIVALTAEEAQAGANRAGEVGAEEFTDVALERLPASAAVFVSDQRTTWRVLAATTVTGRRLDALVITRPLIHRGDVAARLLVREPATEPLLRSLALTSNGDEDSLSEIADVRPLFVEPERGWTEREYGHATVDGAWIRFEPEPLGPFDRKLDVERTMTSLARYFRAVESTEDEESAAVATSIVTAHVKVLHKLGDVTNTTLYLGALDKPGARITPSGSLDVMFAAATSRLPINKTQRDRDKQRSKVREADKKKSPQARREPPKKKKPN